MSEEKTTVSAVADGIARQSRRLKAMKRVQAILAKLDEQDARAVVLEVAMSITDPKATS